MRLPPEAVHSVEEDDYPNRNIVHVPNAKPREYLNEMALLWANFAPPKKKA